MSGFKVGDRVRVETIELDGCTQPGPVCVGCGRDPVLVERMVEFIRKSARSDGGVEARDILAALEPVDPLVVRAREICAVESGVGNRESWVSGERDDTGVMRAVLTALRESRDADA